MGVVCRSSLTVGQTIKGGYGSAIAHIRSGNKVLCEMFYNKGTKEQSHEVLDTSTSLHVPIEELAGIFLRLDLQITSVSSSPRLNPALI